jgi:hypothetical protein
MYAKLSTLDGLVHVYTPDPYTQEERADFARW